MTDPLPAGFEAVESWFATTARDSLGREQDDQSSDGGDASDWLTWWQRGGFDHVERHDDRVQLFATRLSEGRPRVHATSSARRPPARSARRRRAPRRCTTGSVRPDRDDGDRGQAVGDGIMRRSSVCLARQRAQRLMRSWRLHRSAIRAIASLLRSALIGCALWLRLGPLDPACSTISTHATSTVVVDRHGVPLYEALSGDGTRSVQLERREPAADAGRGDDRRRGSPLLVASRRRSDRDRRAALQPNLAEGRVVEGGSTITQQVAKLLLNRRSPKRRAGRCGAKLARRCSRCGSSIGSTSARSCAVSEPRGVRQSDRRRRAREPRLLRRASRPC